MKTMIGISMQVKATFSTALYSISYWETKMK